MEPALLGLVLDSSIIIEAERKHQTVEELLDTIQKRFGEIEIAMYRCIRSPIPQPRLPEPSAENRLPKATRFQSTIY